MLKKYCGWSEAEAEQHFGGTAAHKHLEISVFDARTVVEFLMDQVLCQFLSALKRNFSLLWHVFCWFEKFLQQQAPLLDIGLNHRVLIAFLRLNGLCLLQEDDYHLLMLHVISPVVEPSRLMIPLDGISFLLGF